jgi:pilus assembly protein TadC
VARELDLVLHVPRAPLVIAQAGELAQIAPAATVDGEELAVRQADEVRRLRFARLEQENAKVPSKMLVPIILCIVPAVFITVLVPIILSIKDTGIFSVISQKGIW